MQRTGSREGSGSDPAPEPPWSKRRRGSWSSEEVLAVLRRVQDVLMRFYWFLEKLDKSPRGSWRLTDEVLAGHCGGAVQSAEDVRVLMNLLRCENF